MSYSEKIDHVNNDLEFNIPTVHINEISSDTKLNLEEFISIEREKLIPIAEKARQQEKAIKSVLK
jgi:hypothetical protein